jgi:hypothetical protein
MRFKRIFIAFVLLPVLTAIASDAQISKSSIYAGVTDNTRLEQALGSLKGTTGEWAQKAILGNNLTKKPIKIEFRDLSKISPNYATFDALGWKDGNQLYIFLSNRHKNAPIEALASILCHESIHQDTISSMEEETYGWAYEADVWTQMKNRNPELNKLDPNEYPLVDRLNTLQNLLIKGNYTTKEIYKAVSTNPGYRGLPLHSPGFGE